MEPSPSLKLRHSWLGIASCIVGLVLGLPFVVMLMGAIFIKTLLSSVFGGVPGSIQMGLEPWAMVIMTIGSAVALGLGIAGLRQPDRKRFFPILGCTLSAIAALSLLGMFLQQMS